MARKLFCEISPFTYYLSVKKERCKRHLKNLSSRARFAKTKGDILPLTVYKHNSLIRRKLGNVDMELQENKAINLCLAAPKVNQILIRPNEIFSFGSLSKTAPKPKVIKKA